MAACSTETDESARWEKPPPSWKKQDSEWEGPPAKWSKQITNRSTPTVMMGRVLVVNTLKELLGVDPDTGEALWRTPFEFAITMEISGDLIVVLEQEDWDTSQSLSVVHPKTGEVLWRQDDVSHHLASEDAIFTNTLDGNLIRHDRLTGEQEWKQPAEGFLVRATHKETYPYPLADGSRMLTVEEGQDGKEILKVRDTATGRVVGADIPLQDQSPFLTDRAVVAFDEERPENEDRCTVEITAFDIESGDTRWKREVFNGRDTEGLCTDNTGALPSELALPIQTGDRIAAVTEDGRPQLVDLKTGHTVWHSRIKGAPILGNNRFLLTRTRTDGGDFTLLDFTTGRKLWTVPDPGTGPWEDGSIAITESFVTVQEESSETEAQRVVVYDVEDGRVLGRFPGWIHGQGKDWMAVSYNIDDPAADDARFDFIRF